MLASSRGTLPYLLASSFCRLSRPAGR